MDLIQRLRNAAESWKRTDCMVAREVLSEAALLDEAANRIEELEAQIPAPAPY